MGMPTVTLHIQHGKLDGLSDKDKKAYARFKSRLASLGNSSIVFSWKEPRSGQYHRRFFAMLNSLLESQEQFQDIEHLLAWVKVGAGHADLVPGPKGKPVALAKSINFETLDQVEFEHISSAIIAFLRSTHATRFLWPMLDDVAGSGMVEAVLNEFGE